MSKRVLAAAMAASIAVLVGVVVTRDWGAVKSPEIPGLELRSYSTSAPAGDAEGPTAFPSEWAWIRRTAPYWNADPEAFRQELGRAQSLRKAASLDDRFALSPVVPAGPDNIGGRFSDIEWDPTNANVVYAGAATGGVFKSTDSGNSWTPVADDLPNLNIGDLAVDPNQPQTVWLGTGEPNGGHNNFPGNGLYRSTDGGNNWSFNALANTASIGRIVVDPSNSQRVFVAAQGSYFGPTPERGLYRTLNGGASWQNVLFVSDSAGATDVVIDPTNPNRMLAATWERVRRPNGGTHLFGPGSGIWRSTDGGSTWTKLGAGQGLPDPATQNVGRIGLALCPADPNIAYAVITNGNNNIGLWKSTNFGTSWINNDADLQIQAGGGGFSWYFSQVRVAPDNCSQVYVLDVTFFRSDDSGVNFPIQYGYSGSPADFHVDHHALAFHPTNPAILLEGNDGGINRSTDRGTTWTKVPALPTNQFYEIGLDASNPARLFGGTQDNGTLRTLTGSVSDWTNILGGDGFYVNVDPTNPNVIYAESQFGNLAKTTNSGASWTSVVPAGAASDRKNWSTPVELDPANPSIVYYGTQRLWRSTNGGSAWTAVSPDLSGWVPGAVLGTITTIGISPADPAVVWIGTDDGRVWRGVWGGAAFTWTNVTVAPLPPRWVTRVVPHPTDPQAAWVTFSGLKWRDSESHVFATTNAGASWTDISSNLPAVPINAMTVDPAHPQILFVGTDLGAYFSNNAGGSWQYLSPELPLVTVYDLAIHPTARYLAIGSYGRSMYTLNLDVALDADRPQIAGAELLQSSPNPVVSNTRIGFTLPRDGRARLTVFDVAGRRVRTLADGEWTAGRHEVPWDGTDDGGRRVPAGNYRYRLELPGGEQLTRGMVVVR
jgi:photosystem II stability/assembly factor-like uncharacterized protein